jgi:hypothetical protein
LPRWHRIGEQRHLVRVGRGLSQARTFGTGLGGSLAKFQGHKESASRVGQMVFALRPTGEQVKMFAGVLEVFLNWFRPPRPGPVSTPPGGKRAGQDTESLVEVDVADELKFDVYHHSNSSPLSFSRNRR